MNDPFTIPDIPQFQHDLDIKHRHLSSVASLNQRIVTHADYKKSTSIFGLQNTINNKTKIAFNCDFEDMAPEMLEAVIKLNSDIEERITEGESQDLSRRAIKNIIYTSIVAAGDRYNKGVINAQFNK